MSLIRQDYFRNFIIASSMLISFMAFSTEEIPQYCKDNFPALNTRALDQETISSYDNQTCHINTPDNQRISVAAEDLLKFYSRTQRVEYRQSVEQFREKLKKKVMHGIARSTHDYEDLFPRMNCEYGSDPYASLASSACEDRQNFTPRCRDEELQAVIDEENANHAELKLNEVYHEFEAADALMSIPDFSIESISREDQRQVRLALDRQKKLYFYKNHVKSTLLLKSTLQQKVAAEERYETAKRAASARGPGRRHSCVSKPNQRHCEALRVVETNYEQEKAQIDISLGVLYQQHPTLFDIQNRFEFFDWFNSEYAQSEFGQKLEAEALADLPELANLDDPSAIAEFLDSDEGNAKLNQLSTRLVDSPVLAIEDAGRKKVNEEKQKKKDAMEHLCKSDGSDLHHFDHLAKEVLEESKTDGRTHLADQAGYCYLVQTEPKESGGLGIAALLGATAAVVGGVVLQFVPVVGNLAGAGLIASAVGGLVFSYDAYDRYSVAADERAATETVYQGSNVWASSRDLLEAQDKARNQAALAAAEVSLSALDAALIVRPAVSLALRLGRRPAEIAAVTGVVDEAPSLSLRATTIDRVAPIEADRAVVAPRRPTELTSPALADELPAVQTGPVRAARSTLSAAQTRTLENFHGLTTVEKRRIVDLIEEQIRTSNTVNEDAFMTLMMYRGNYTPANFTAEAQDLARAIMGASNEEQALTLLRNFYGTNDPQRLRGLEDTVGRLFDVPARVAIAPVVDSNPILQPTLTSEVAETVALPAPDEVLRIAPPERLTPITSDDIVPAITNTAESAFRITPAQRTKLENFNRLTTVEKRRIADIIEERFINSQTIDEDAFLALIMYRGSYTPNVFTPGVQDMAHRLMMAPSQDEALRIAREFYQGKPSARSAERLRSLEDTIERLYSVRSPTPEIAAPTRAVAQRVTGTALVPVEAENVLPVVAGRGVTSPVPFSPELRGLEIPGESVPLLNRPDEVLQIEDLRQPAAVVADEDPSVLRLSVVPEDEPVVNTPAVADTTRIVREIRERELARNPIPLVRGVPLADRALEDAEPAPTAGTPPEEVVEPAPEPVSDPEPVTPPVPDEVIDPEVTAIHPVIENKDESIPDGATEIILRAKVVLPEGVEAPADLKFIWTFAEVQGTETTTGTSELLPDRIEGAQEVELPVRGDVYTVILSLETADPNFSTNDATDEMQIGYDSLRTKYITVTIENRDSVPAEGERTHTLTAVATVDGGGELPADFKFKWVYTDAETLEDIDKAPDGASSFAFPLHRWSYSVSASGEAEGYEVRQSPAYELSLNCGLHSTGCSDEEEATETAVDPVEPLPPWPEFAPVTPPSRFSPAPMPQPQFYIIPGFP